MKALAGFVMLALSGACSSNQTPEALSCRGAITRASSLQVKTIIEVTADGPAISHFPLRCPNMMFSFSGSRANAILAKMSEVAANTAGGRARFEIEVLGTIGHDESLQIPSLEVNTVLSVTHLH